MKFGLRRQLLLIGVLTLALPLASVFYIRETEAALRDAQNRFLAELAKSMVPLLDAGIGNNEIEPLRTADGALFALPLTRTPTLDGYREDWGLDNAARAANREPPRVWLGDDNGTLWLHARIERAANFTPRFELVCVAANGSYRAMPFAPTDRGTIALTSTDGAPPIRVSWQPDANVAQLELRIPANDCAQRLGFSVRIDQQHLSTFGGSMPGPVQRISNTISANLRANRPAGIEAFVVSPTGWRITPIVGDRAPVDEAQQNATFATTLYRRLLGSDGRDLPPLSDAWRVDARTLPAVTAGSAQTRRLRNPDDLNGTVAMAVAPLTGALDGFALVLRQNTSAILTLANPSLVRLTNWILIVTALVVGLLLAFATWLSARIRRLARAAGAAITNRGDIRPALPGNAAIDEIGEVTRSFETLLRRVREQQQWLKSLADTLSHELRTPIAVVQSSLDNLSHSELSDAQRALSNRASDGVARLRATLNAMSTANRAEQAAREAQFASVDVSALLTQLVEAYRHTFATQTFAAELADNVTLHGNAELLVQMLDKLVENATQFAPTDSTIALLLNTANGKATISVTNTGPALPDGDPAQLFNSFVSARSDNDAGQHLGFGLYIARLIAEAHNGTITARDVTVETVSGVTVSVTLPISHAES
ncbi:MAG: ATP-binding protein [Pseudomonadota bacterium]